MGTITLPNVRATSDVKMNTRLKDGGVYIEWSSLTDIKAWIYSDAQKAIAGRCDVSVNPEDNTKLLCEYAASKPQYLGVNRLIVQGRYNGSLKTYDKPVFNFVPRTAEATGSITISDPEVDVEIEVTDTTSSILDNTIAAALAAAAHAEHAASLVPLQVLQDCEAATAVALTAASKAPVIGENGHWWVWNSQQAAYVDTGKQAKGDTGNGIASFSVVESQEDDADNVVTVTFTDGTTETFTVKNGKTGNGIASIVQTVESPDDAGTNVITVTMTNGTVITFNVKNGSKGQPGAAQAAYKSVETLPTASAETMDKIYLTPSGTSGVFNMSYTDYDGSAYSWVDLGTSAIQLSDYTTKAEFSQLEAEVDGLDTQINGGTETIIDYTVTITSSGESTGYPDLRNLSGYVDGKTYKITIEANESVYIRINTRNDSNQTVQEIADGYQITSGQTYTFYWTKQSTETRLFSTSNQGKTYKCVFTISHDVSSPGLLDNIQDLQTTVGDIEQDVADVETQLDGGAEQVTDYTKTVTTSGESSGFPDINNLSGYQNGKTYTIRIQANEDASIQIKTRDSNASTVQSIADAFSVTNGQTYEFQWTKQSSEVRLFSMTNNGKTYKCVFSILHDEHTEGISEKVERMDSSIPQKGFSHISFDDVVYCLNDITVNANVYNSIFENDFFAVLKDLHDTYGAVFSLFVFLEDATTGEHATGWTLAGTTNKFATEFQANSSWLKFGLHAPNKNINYSSRSQENTVSDYQSFVTSILAITGTVDCIDRLPRLANFAGTETNLIALRDCDAGIIGALSAYDTRDSYYLTSEESGLAYKNGVLVDATNHIAFYTSLSALETTDPATVYGARLIPATMGRFFNLEWMMHEYALGGQDHGYSSYNWDTMVARLETVCQYATRGGYKWGYPQNAALRAGM